jgi:LPXTG-motif cell wall-anchored protein
VSARDWIILAAVLLGVGLALFFVLRRRKKGCGCGCSGSNCCDCCKKGTDKPDKL